MSGTKVGAAKRLLKIERSKMQEWGRKGGIASAVSKNHKSPMDSSERARELQLRSTKKRKEEQ